MRSALIAALVFGLFAPGAAAQQAGQIVGGDDVQTTFTGAGSGTYCVIGRHYNFHPMGVMGANATLTANFRTDPAAGDITAAAISVELGTDAEGGSANVGFVTNDDSGGSLDPRVVLQTTELVNVVLAVGPFSPSRTAAICYQLQVVCTGVGCDARTASTP